MPFPGLSPSPIWCRRDQSNNAWLLHRHGECTPGCTPGCTTSPMRMLSKWPWISRCGDYWQQVELRTDGACRIMMMMMIFLKLAAQRKANISKTNLRYVRKSLPLLLQSFQLDETAKVHDARHSAAVDLKKTRY